MTVGGLYCIDVIAYSCYHLCNECEVTLLDVRFLEILERFITFTPLK